MDPDNEKDNMTNISNISEGSRSPETQDTLWYWWLNGVINTITVLGNAMVILLILTRSSLRTTQNCFVLSLAVADLLVGSVVFPLEFAWFYLRTPDIDYKTIFNAIFDFTMYASTTNLCALTLDRYVSIVHPLKYIHMKKKSNVITTLAGVWIAAFLFSFLSLLFNLFVKSANVFVGYHIFLLCFCETFPCICLPIAFFRIRHFVRRQQTLIKVQTNQLQHNYPENNERGQNAKNSKRMIRVLGGVIGFFFFSHVLFIIPSWMRYVLSFPKINPVLYYISYLLLFANSAVNVFFYGLFKKDFRGEMIKLFR